MYVVEDAGLLLLTNTVDKAFAVETENGCDMLDNTEGLLKIDWRRLIVTFIEENAVNERPIINNRFFFLFCVSLLV